MLSREALIVALAAEHLAYGQELTQRDRTRLTEAAVLLRDAVAHL
jgi:hypothetical protein